MGVLLSSIAASSTCLLAALSTLPLPSLLSVSLCHSFQVTLLNTYPSRSLTPSVEVFPRPFLYAVWTVTTEPIDHLPPNPSLESRRPLILTHHVLLDYC